MARGNEIIVSADPQGKFLEGIISGTPKPGTLMQLKAGVAMKGGRFTWEAATPVGGDGKPSIVAVLLADNLQGKTATDAYVTGTRCFLYCPIAGEDLNVLVGEGAGTANTFAVGDYLMLDAEDGILIPSSSPVSAPFIVLETETQVTGSTLVWCKYSGHAIWWMAIGVASMMASAWMS